MLLSYAAEPVIRTISFVPRLALRFQERQIEVQSGRETSTETTPAILIIMLRPFREKNKKIERIFSA